MTDAVETEACRCDVDPECLTELFPEEEPPGQAPKTVSSFHCSNGATITLNLVGHHPLWGHVLWNASRVCARLLEENSPILCRGKRILELGAGAGLPSLLSSALGAKKVVATEYPDSALLECLRENALANKTPLDVQAYIWGREWRDPDETFDFIFLSDLIFNHSQHDALLRTVQARLDQGGVAFVLNSHHVPAKAHKDMEFFTKAQSQPYALKVSELARVYTGVMFEQDRKLDHADGDYDKRAHVWLRALTKDEHGDRTLEAMSFRHLGIHGRKED